LQQNGLPRNNTASCCDSNSANAGRDRRLQKLFNCIYSLFQGSFIYWILHKYDNSTNKNKLWEDAKDAFQNGMMVLYRKSQEKGFNIKGNLKTTVYSFGLLQLLALFKKKTASNFNFETASFIIRKSF